MCKHKTTKTRKWRNRIDGYSVESRKFGSDPGNHAGVLRLSGSLQRTCKFIFLTVLSALSTNEACPQKCCGGYYVDYVYFFVLCQHNSRCYGYCKRNYSYAETPDFRRICQPQFYIVDGYRRSEYGYVGKNQYCGNYQPQRCRSHAVQQTLHCLAFFPLLEKV